ncbi:MAG: photosynthetic reaction center cytochrome c subunit [Gammaproteobacteria bacterium]|nr:photosynthetic reaction center cytochrome c subunit [Gammaproteobacteria bacterium]
MNPVTGIFRARRFVQVAGAAVLASLGLAGCELPTGKDSEQLGYRGTGMEQVTNARTEAQRAAANQAPPSLDPVEPAGPLAGDLYDNVKVLGDLTITEFNRLMNAMTEWVSPEAGCNYCHVPGDFADENIYTKVVSRRMLEMTKAVNEQWEAHVGDTGVTCYTCHQGQPVPEYVWFDDPGPRQAGGMAASRRGQNLASSNAGSTSLPHDPFSPYLLGDREIRTIPTTMLPEGSNPGNIMDTEGTYSLMIHFSESLGVNCTYCHNTRSFVGWEGSPPQRTSAWHGIRMVRELNLDYLDPLQPVYPESQLGPHGDAPKAHCGTCHQGVNKPLYGASMLADYPELDKVRRVARAAMPAAEPVVASAVVQDAVEAAEAVEDMVDDDSE